MAQFIAQPPVYNAKTDRFRFFLRFSERNIQMFTIHRKTLGRVLANPLWRPDLLARAFEWHKSRLRAAAERVFSAAGGQFRLDAYEITRADLSR